MAMKMTMERLCGTWGTGAVGAFLSDTRARLEEDLAAGRLTEEEYDEAMDADNSLSPYGLDGRPFFALKRNIKKSTRAPRANSSVSAHGVDENLIRSLPDLIRSPALVVVSDGRVSVITGEKIDTLHEKNAPLLIGIDPNSSVDGESANEVKSIYGREKFAQWLELRAKDSKIMAGDESKASALLRDVGIETTEPVAYADDLTQMIIDYYELSVNEQFSFGDDQRDTKRIAADLLRMLNSGTSTAKLRRYVDGIDGRNQRTTLSRDASPAERIVWAAHRQGLSVDEYLRQNWELYDVDGELNEDAREALELEQGQNRSISERDLDIQYSFGEEDPYDGRSLSTDSELYTWEFLSSLPDMEITVLPEVSSLLDEDGSVDPSRVLAAGQKNTLSAGEERDKGVFVRNNYTGRVQFSIEEAEGEDQKAVAGSFQGYTMTFGRGLLCVGCAAFRSML